MLETSSNYASPLPRKSKHGCLRNLKRFSLLSLTVALLLASYKLATQQVYRTTNATCDPTPGVAWSTNHGPNIYGGESYKLVFYDEFDGNALDQTKWDTKFSFYGPPYDRTHDFGSGDELQYYDDNNVTVSGGAAHLRGEKLTTPVVYSGHTKWFKTGMLCSRQQFQWGRIEMRCRVPAGPSGWIGSGYKPAFWLIGGCCGRDEVDIFEMEGDVQGGIQTTLHENPICQATPNNPDCSSSNCMAHAPWADRYGNGGPTNYGYGNVADGNYHTYAIAWEGGCTRWYYDGALIRTVGMWYNSIGQEICDQFIPFQPYYQRSCSPDEALNIIANLQILSSAGDPNGPDAVFPGTMDIDYIRVFQRMPDGDPRDLCNRPCAVTGPQTLCSGALTLQVAGTSAQQAIKWTTSPNLSTIGSTDQTSVLVQRASGSTTSASGYVDVTITGGVSPACGSGVRTIRYPIYIGPPPVLTATYTANGCSGEGSIAVQGVVGARYNWTLTGASAVAMNGAVVDFVFPISRTNTVRYVNYSVDVVNDCGRQTKTGRFPLPRCNGGPVRPAGDSPPAPERPETGSSSQ